MNGIASSTPATSARPSSKYQGKLALQSSPSRRIDMDSGATLPTRARAGAGSITGAAACGQEFG